MTTLHEAAQQVEQQRIQELEQELAAEIELRGKLEQECVNWRVKYTNLEMAQHGEQHEPDTRTDYGGWTFPIELPIIQNQIKKDISTAQPDDAIIRAWQAGYYHAGYTNDQAYADKMAREYAGAAPAPQAQQEPVAQLDFMECAPKYLRADGHPMEVEEAPHPDTRKVIEQLLYCVEAWERGCLHEDYRRDRDDAITEGQKWLEENK